MSNSHDEAHVAFVTTGSIKDIATSKRAFGLAEPLTLRGVRVTIIAEENKENRHRINVEAPSAQTAWFKKTSAFGEWRAKRSLLRFIKPTHVYCSSPGFRNQVAMAFGCDRPLFIVEHSELLSSVETRSSLQRLTDYLSEFLAALTFDGHVAASRFLYEYLSELSAIKGRRPVLHSPYAYSPSMLRAVPVACGKIISQLAGRKSIVYMGTLSRNYGIFLMLAAVERMARVRNDFILHVIGSGRDASAAKTEAERLGIDSVVEFTGYVSDDLLPAYLATASSFVAPLFDTVQDRARCPSKLFMYLPFKRPIVTCCIGEAAELFGNDYEFYFREGDVEHFALAMLQSLECKGEWAASWQAEAHSWESRADILVPWLLNEVGAEV